ncbi:bifunctional metallophosphatase/5'-nucleotidase [Virgibacillus sp. NKC19-3]|uniref:bifunctional metallophosphatase/5'-nucleotidase n=1 Tax=Virgibacillus saliphilus TaxID=2831674 RepID=UPI001C9A8342|nr:bifunctional UDP-sugar hydrolase/5'-nucleotidase [Virgibacillus sp. NKC19-3]MBY7143995.1 bifunctional metallophosphatase/5'-nucleotidase [Virgibacillus sp. NKC19-3]
MQEKLYFYYTNDLHSNFDQWPRVASFLKEAKASRAETNESCWLIDIGDHVDRVHPIAEAFMGRANVALMNDVGYDLVTLGNNEGITLGHDELFHLYDDATFQVVCANLHSMNNDEPDWLQPTVNIHSVGGVKVGVIGLTAPFNAFYELLNWHVAPPYKTLEKYVNQLKQTTDIIILLSHLGLNEDQEIARRFKAIDVIIGGHTHHLLRTGEHINNTVITAAGKHCAFVGEVMLTWDHTRQELVKKEAYTTDITHIAKDMQTEQNLYELEERADEILEKKIVHITSPIEIRWFTDTRIMQELTNTVKDWTKADCAMLNSGLLLDQLPAGDVTYKDIHRICPHPINPVVVELTGDELLEVIRAAFTKDFMELKLKGFGFRGEVLGRMLFAGLQVETDMRETGEEYVRDVTFQGYPLESDHIYSVATADTFTFGRLLPEIAKSETKRYFLPEFLRDLLADTLRDKFGDES